MSLIYDDTYSYDKVLFASLGNGVHAGTKFNDGNSIDASSSNHGGHA